MSGSLRKAALSALSIPTEQCRVVGRKLTLEASIDHFLQLMRSGLQRPNQETALP